MSFQPEIPERDYRPIHPEPAWRSLARKIWAPIAVAVGLILKFGFAVAKFASIFVAVGGYALLWGWQFAVGFVLLIFVHELGHFVEARRRGFNAVLAGVPAVPRRLRRDPRRTDEPLAELLDLVLRAALGERRRRARLGDRRAAGLAVS